MARKILGFDIACHPKRGQFLLGEADEVNFSWGWGVAGSVLGIFLEVPSD